MLKLNTIQITLALFVISELGVLDGCTAETATVPAAVIRDRTTADMAVRARLENVQLLSAWNMIALRTTAAGPFSPPRETRAMAIVSGAVFDAVNSITRRYEPWVVRAHARHDASVDAAVSSAARHVLVALYPSLAASVDAAYDSLVALVPNGKAKDAGLAVGLVAADAALDARAHDHATDAVSYTPGLGSGVWSPTPPAFTTAATATLALAIGAATAMFSLVSVLLLRPTPGRSSALAHHRCRGARPTCATCSRSARSARR